MKCDLGKISDDISVSMAMRGLLNEGEYLPPRLWNDLRLRLQNIYREATGEEHATIYVDTERADR